MLLCGASVLYVVTLCHHKRAITPRTRKTGSLFHISTLTHKHTHTHSHNPLCKARNCFPRYSIKADLSEFLDEQHPLVLFACSETDLPWLSRGKFTPHKKTIKLCNKWELTRERYLHFCLHGNLPRWSFWGYGWYRPGSTQLSACINPLSGSVWLFWNGILHHLNSFHLVHWDEIKGLSAPDKDVLLDSL